MGARFVGSSGLASHLDVVWMALVHWIGKLEGRIDRNLLARIVMLQEGCFARLAETKAARTVTDTVRPEGPPREHCHIVESLALIPGLSHERISKGR